MQVLLSVDELIADAAAMLGAAMAERDIVTPAVEGEVGPWRGLVGVHYFNNRDRCSYLHWPQSPFKAAHHANLIDPAILTQVYLDYARVIAQYRDVIAAAVEHVRNLLELDAFLPCALDEMATRKLENYLARLDHLVRGFEDGATEQAIENIRNRLLADYREHIEAEASGSYTLPEIILRCLPDDREIPISGGPLRSDEELKKIPRINGHKWLGNAKFGDYSLPDKDKISEFKPWEQLHFLTSFLVVGPWLGIDPNVYRSVFKAFGETGTRGWGSALAQIPSGSLSSRELRLKVGTPLAPSAEIFVYHNAVGRKGVKEAERKIRDAVLAIGGQLQSNLTHHAVLVAVEHFSTSGGEEGAAWSAIDHVFPCLHVTPDKPGATPIPVDLAPLPYGLSPDPKGIKPCTTLEEEFFMPLVTEDGRIRYHVAYETDPHMFGMDSDTKRDRQIFWASVNVFVKRIGVLCNAARRAARAQDEADQHIDRSQGDTERSRLARFCFNELAMATGRAKGGVWNTPLEILRPFICWKVLAVNYGPDLSIKDLLAKQVAAPDDFRPPEGLIDISTREIRDAMKPFIDKAEECDVEIKPSALNQIQGTKKREVFKKAAEYFMGNGIFLTIVDAENTGRGERKYMHKVTIGVETDF